MRDTPRGGKAADPGRRGTVKYHPYRMTGMYKAALPAPCAPAFFRTA